MATPRKSYFRVADSILYEGWDDNQIATCIRLLAHLNTRWAREGRSSEEACGSRLDRGDVAKITGKHRADVALTSLQRLADVTSMSLRVDGKVIEINWPKYAIFQELRTLETPLNNPPVAPSAPSPSPSPSPSPDKDIPASQKTQEPEASKRGTRQGKKTVCPERLDPEDRDRLIEWAATNFRLTRPQVVHAWQSVKAWALTNDHRRVDWVMVTQGAIRKGWALDGYKESDDDKYQRELAASPFRRTDGDQANAN